MLRPVCKATLRDITAIANNPTLAYRIDATDHSKILVFRVYRWGEVPTQLESYPQGQLEQRSLVDATAQMVSNQRPIPVQERDEFHAM